MPFPTSTVQKPCKRGHTTGRDANGTCKQCRRDAARLRYKNNPAIAEKVKAGAVAWRKANPDKTAAKGRAYRKNNPEQTLLESARDRARRRGQPCTITRADITIPRFCPLLGVRLTRGAGTGGHGPKSPSLDRKDPRKGYVPGNVWVISHRANVLKGDATLRELQKLVERLARVFS